MSKEILWYKKPACMWAEGMPIGNGWLGGMILGEITKEDVSINLDSLWSGSGRDKNIKNNSHHVKKVRDLMKENKITQAETYISEHLVSEFSETFLPAADLHLKFANEIKDKASYKRILDLERAIINIDYDEHHREAFCSYVDQVMVYKVVDDNLDMTIGLTSKVKYQTSIDENHVMELKGLAPTNICRKKEIDYVPVYDEEEPGMTFDVTLTVDTDGKIEIIGEEMRIVHGSYAILYLTGQTDLDNREDSRTILTRAKAWDYNTLRNRHIEDFGGLYNRVSLQLGECTESGLDIEERLDQYQQDKNDDGLITLAFNFGRYLIISGSRVGSRATNLQGIWNFELQPVWQSNYTVNINTQMNYWPVEVCNLSECHEPLFAFLDLVSEKGKVTAREHYDCDGWVSHHNIDIWGHTTPVGKGAGEGIIQAAFWPMSSGWLSIHLYEHYLFTEDKEFLEKRALPIMIESAKFYLDWLIEEGDSLITMPSTSPENRYMLGDIPMSIGKNTTMDRGIIRKLFRSIIASLDITETHPELKEKLIYTLSRIKPYEIGKYGQLMEWDEDFEDSDQVHRHVSHLLPLYPSDDITVENTPDLAEACGVSLDRRGDSGTGWSLSWKVLLRARLKDGNRAYSLLKRYLKPTKDVSKNYYHGGIYNSLLCAHPPFQIDGNCGITAAIAEMLIQSHNDYIELLPALPDDWKDGELKGVKARGNYTVSFSWANGSINKLFIHSKKKNCSVRLNGIKKVYPCNKLIEIK